MAEGIHTSPRRTRSNPIQKVFMAVATTCARGTCWCSYANLEHARASLHTSTSILTKGHAARLGVHPASNGMQEENAHAMDVTSVKAA